MNKIAMELKTSTDSVSLSSALTIARRLLTEAVNEQGGPRAVAAKLQTNGVPVFGTPDEIAVVYLEHRQQNFALKMRISMAENTTITEVVDDFLAWEKAGLVEAYQRG